jgi:hypothetical protein
MRVRFNIDKNANNGRSPIFLIAAERTSFEGYNDCSSYRLAPNMARQSRKVFGIPGKGFKRENPFQRVEIGHEEYR